MSYLSKDAAVQGVQLRVQSLVLRLSDTDVMSVAGDIATVDVKETILAIVNAIFVDDSAGTAAPVAAANRTVTGTQVALDLGGAMAAADSIILNYVVAE